MAKAFRSSFTALFVETPDYAAMTEDNKKRLRENTKLAEQLGAKIETVFGDDVPYQIAEFAQIIRHFQNCYREEHSSPQTSVQQTHADG